MVSYVIVVVGYVTILYTLYIGQSAANLALRQSGTFPPVQGGDSQKSPQFLDLKNTDSKCSINLLL